jgi:glycerophosphoryl diester phosphodiesterase
MLMIQNLILIYRARFIRQITLLIILGLLCASCGGGSDNQQQSVKKKGESHAYEWLMDPTSTGLLVAAHRGAHKNLPENSLAAIRESADLGADFAEVDVRHTQDGVLVLMHDSNTVRTTGFDAELNTLTYAQVQTLTLLKNNPSNPETIKVPTFAAALALARETGIMLYVDVRTERDDLVVAAVQAGPYYDVTLLRDTLTQLLKMWARDSGLLFLPPAGNVDELNVARAALPGLRIVESYKEGPDAELCAAARKVGIKVQQDVFVQGDIPAALIGDYSGWAKFVSAGVWLLQTDQPDLLIPAVFEYRETGVFPSGP